MIANTPVTLHVTLNRRLLGLLLGICGTALFVWFWMTPGGHRSSYWYMEPLGIVFFAAFTVRAVILLIFPRCASLTLDADGFEIGHVFRQLAGGPEERHAVAWLLLRGAGPESWLDRDEPDELYRLKGEALAALNTLGLRVATESADGLPFPFVAGRAVRLLDMAGRTLGYVGALDHRAYGTTPAQAAYGVELWLPAPVWAPT